MITFHPIGQPAVDCSDLGHCHSLMKTAVWVDLHNPTEQEEIIVDMAFGIDLPTRREMQEIEVSRRLYKVNDVLFMTAPVITHADTAQPDSSAVTFIFSEQRLITLRYASPLPFQTFRLERESDLTAFDTGPRVFEGLMSAMIERLADLLENAGATLDNISQEIFLARTAKAAAATGDATPQKRRDLEEVIRRLGQCSDLISRVRESLASLGRVISFFCVAQRHLPSDLGEKLHSLSHDLQPLGDHASFLSQKVNFLLDATLGLINIEQNAIIKIFTVAAVLFLPPTVVGTIYGMNFEIMPELKWAFGYPFAIAMMIVSAILPYHYFKRRGWF